MGCASKYAASRPCKLFLLGFETATWHVETATWHLRASKASKAQTAAFESSSMRHHRTSLGPDKLFLLGFETVTWHVETAMWHLRASKASKASFRRLLHTAPWYAPRPHRLFLLGFETATWHVLAPFKSLNTQNPPQKLVRHGLWLHLCLVWHPSTLLLGPANCFYWVSKLLRGTF